MRTTTVYAVHSRLGQLYADAVHDGLVAKSPVSRRTSPGAGEAAALRGHYRAGLGALRRHAGVNSAGILLGAFAGLRVGEDVALRVGDVDFMRGIIAPAIQYPHEELKTDAFKTPVPIPRELAGMLNHNPVKWGSETIVTGEWGRAMAVYTFEERFRTAREKVKGLPEGFRFHDLRHYFASLLIHQGLDIKTVQRCLRHASAKTALDTYGQLWPDKDESARAAIQQVLAARADSGRAKPATSA